MGDTRLVEETIDVAPEAEQHNVHTLSAYVQSISIESEELLYTYFGPL